VTAPSPTGGHHRIRRSSPADTAVLPAVFLAGCLVIVLRGPSTVLHPQLWAEDGAVFYHDAYMSGWLAPLGHAQVGYLQTLSRAVADVGLLVPLREVPLLFMVVGLIVQILPAVVIASRRYAALIPDYRVRLLLAAIYLLLPNTSAIDANLTNAQWHLGLLALLVVLATPATHGWQIFDVAVVLLSGLTGPFALSLIVVIALYYWRRRQTWTLILGMVTVVCALIQLGTLLTSPRPGGGPLGISVVRLVDILGGRMVVSTVLGDSLTNSMPFTRDFLLYSSGFLVLGAAVIGFALWRGPLELKLLNLFVGCVLAGTLASPLAGTHGSEWQALVAGGGSRYWLMPSFAFMVDVVWVAGQRIGHGRVVAVLAIVTLATFASFGIREGFRYPSVLAPSWSSQVRSFDRLPPHSHFVFEIRPQGWKMVITKK